MHRTGEGGGCDVETGQGSKKHPPQSKRHHHHHHPITKSQTASNAYKPIGGDHADPHALTATGHLRKSPNGTGTGTGSHDDGLKRSTSKRMDAAAANDALKQSQVMHMLTGEDGEFSDDGGKDDGHLHTHSENDHGGGRIPLYSEPHQRQRWGEDQVLPHVNWADLFFDLFYVAMAYNLGTLLLSTLTTAQWRRGVLYFIATFGPLYNMWEAKTGYDARFQVSDIFHQTVEIARVFFLSLSVQHIKAVEVMADPLKGNALGYCVGVFAEAIIQVLLQCELWYRGQGDRESIRRYAKSKIVNLLPVVCLYLVAMAIAASQHWDEAHSLAPELSGMTGGAGGGCDESGGHRWLLTRWLSGDAATTVEGTGCGCGELRLLSGEGSAPDAAAAYQDGGGPCDEEHRFLGAAAASTALMSRGHKSDLPFVLTLIAYLLHNAIETFRMMYILPKMPDFRVMNVPCNVDYQIHRYGEWTMLMLGEAVLSLLIVDTAENVEYYLVTFLGVITVIVLMTIKYQSEPAHAEGHALWRSLAAGQAYDVFIQILSMGLIAFGVSYKSMLKTIFKESLTQDADTDGRGGHRFLGGSSVDVTSAASVSLFCGSLALTLIALELMVSSHAGWRVFNHDPDLRRVADLIFKAGIITIAATESIWLTAPVHAALVGLFIVMSVAISRIYWWKDTFSRKNTKVSLQHIVIFSAAINKTQWEAVLEAFDVDHSDFKDGNLEKKAMDIFDRIDVNGNGRLDNGEFHLALKEMGVDLDEERVARMLKGVDKDGDREIDKEEFLAFLTAKLSKKKRSFGPSAMKANFLYKKDSISIKEP